MVLAVEKVSPAVVNISSEYEVSNRANPFFDPGVNDALKDFFNDFFEPRYRNKTKRYNLGSGVIIDGKRGYILTNAHVIEKTSHITVTLNDNREFDAQVVGADPESDLAVLKIKSKVELPSVAMGNSHDLMIGETVIAIGNPFGFSNTVSTGVISATDRNIKSDNRVYKNFIQIDAPINPGNSGGPLLNILGELIGINTAIYANAQGIGFAIPIDRARRIIANLIKYGEIVEGWTGLVIQDIDQDIADYLSITLKKGVLVKDIENDSPAEKSGFKKWDVIESVNSMRIENADHFQSIIHEFSAGNVLKFSVIRSGKTRTVSLTMTTFPLSKAQELGLGILGIRVVAKSSVKGVIINEISRRSQLYATGVRPGDQICQINDIEINNNSDYRKAIVKYRNHNSLVVLIVRNGTGYYITLQL